jgi:tricorn protease-like protein
MRFLRGMTVSVSILLCRADVFAQSSSIVSPHFPTNEDLRHLRQIGPARLSPDGKSVLVQISDSTADGGKSHLFLIDLAQNTYRQLTFSPTGDPKSESAGEWMPDGEMILFFAHRGERNQLFSLPLRGGEVHPFDFGAIPRFGSVFFLTLSAASSARMRGNAEGCRP